jgi:hypothetical protein
VKTVFDLPIFRDVSKTLLSYAGGYATKPASRASEIQTIPIR